MSLLARLGSWRLDDGVVEHATASTVLLGGGGDVAQVAGLPESVAAAFGLSVGEVIDRTTAMRIPAVRRARQVVCGIIGAQPLIAHRYNLDGSVTDVTTDPERALLRQPDPNTTLQYQLTWTVDDLFFYGVSWWLVIDRDPQGFPRRATRLDRSRVSIDLARGRVCVDGIERADRDVIRFDGPDEGVLEYGGPTLTTTKMLDDAVRNFARLDVPLGALKLAEGAKELSNAPNTAFPDDPDDDRSQVDYLLDCWEDARRRRTTAFLNRAVDYQTYQLDAEAVQLAEGRQQQRIDIANLCNVPPRVVNAPSADSMTYSTTQAERADLVDTSLSGYLAAIEQRLSLGDVTPRGTLVRVDLSRFLQGDPKTALEAAGLAVQLQAMTPAEVRTDVLGRTPLQAGAPA